MDRRMLTSAVVIHAGACLVAFMAMGSPETFQEDLAPAPSRKTSGKSNEKKSVLQMTPQMAPEMAPEQMAPEMTPAPLSSMNAFQSEAADPDSENNEVSEVPGGSSGHSSDHSSGDSLSGSSSSLFH